MFDTMTGVKVVGGFCGALLVFLLAKWAADSIYLPEGHVGETEQAYVIDTGEEESGGSEGGQGGGAELTFAAAFSQAKVSAGESTFRQCQSCHNVEEQVNAVGPYLNGVVGRDVASVEDYNYSDALASVEGQWTPETLDPWLENPQQDVSGTKMGFAGLSDIQDRANVIKYLMEYSDYEYTPPEQAAQSGGESGGNEQSSQTASAEGAGGAGGGQAGGGNANGGQAAAQSSGGADGSGGSQQGGGGASSGGSETTQAAAGSGGGGSGGGGSDAFQKAYANADASAGESVFRQCQACHVATEQTNKVGPYLMGVVGRDIASVESFQYSDALKSKDGAWTPGKLSQWIEAPQKFASGTKMGFAGLKDVKKRADVIKYLESTGG